MSAAQPRQLQRLEARVAETANRHFARDETDELQSEIRELKQEIESLRTHFIERERKGTLLMDAYKQVLSDMTALFDAQRQENIKRDESIRFFLSSIESKIVADIRRELNGKSPEGATSGWFSRGRK